jgi:hypothetical protein
MKIDDKLMSIHGYCFKFYLKYKNIKGEIKSNKPSVRAGEKVDISWKAERN